MLKFKINIPLAQLSLPFLFWIPKFHKIPSKQRFIAASYCCSTKTVSSILTKVLKLIYESHKVYCNRIRAYTGYNCMWIIQNSLEIHEVLNTCQSKAKNLKTYDFSTLYTSIPHDKLKEKVSNLVIKSFDAQDWKFICVKNDRVSWCNIEKKNNISLSCDDVVFLLHWLIDNTYVTVGNKIFKQCIGIPMGTDCAPYLANLFLYAYEFDFMNKLIKDKNWLILRKFSKCFRYIDDLLTINNDNFMEKWKTKIYPQELSLTCEDKTDQEVNFLDLHLEIKKNIFSYRLFDKRDNFKFPIVNFPNLSGNIPTSQSYNVFTAQLIRYARGCLHLQDFYARVKVLVLKLLNQNFKLCQLQRTYSKFLVNRYCILTKYGLHIETHLTKIIL